MLFFTLYGYAESGRLGFFTIGTLVESFGGGIRLQVLDDKLDLSFGYLRDALGIREFDRSSQGTNDPGGLGWWGKGNTFFTQFAYNITVPYTKNTTAYPFFAPSISSFNHHYSSLQPQTQNRFSLRVGLGFEHIWTKRINHGLSFQLCYRYTKFNFSHYQLNGEKNTYTSGYTPMSLEGRYTFFLKRKKDKKKQDYTEQLATQSWPKEVAKEPTLSTPILNVKEDEILHHYLLFEFPIASTTLNKVNQDRICSVANYLKNKPALYVNIHGHTDNTGTSQFNKNLSIRRAQYIKSLLLECGLPHKRILNVKGFSFLQPIADNKTKEGRAKNRRVEIVEVNLPH